MKLELVQHFAFLLTLSLHLFTASAQSRQLVLPSDSTVTSIYPSASQPLSSPANSSSRAIQWDKYSLVIAGKRQFLFCAEFHPFRQPSTDLWSDILEKIASAGFNCVSIYLHWGLIQTSPDSPVSLTGPNDLSRFLLLAESVGLFIVVRPGPYINAETTGGGLPPWLSRLDGVLRTDDENWSQAWKPYIKKVVETLKPHQLAWNPETGEVGGGGVIAVQADNEYHSGKKQNKYMEELVRLMKEWGVQVPITYNDSGRDGNFIGLVDLWGYDTYFQRFDCQTPEVWIQAPTDYLAFHESVTPNQPFYIPEFQGGSYDPFSGASYAKCYEMTNQNFSRVANLNLLAQRVTILSLYMVYGGTNWGNLAEPDVYTSYDYGASITENRQLTRKYQELKFQGLFLRSFPELVRSDDVPMDSKSSELLVRQLFNSESGSRFYFVQHKNSSSFDRTSYSLTIETSYKNVTLPTNDSEESKLYLDGRDSRMIVTDKVFKDGAHMLYTTARVIFAGSVGTNRDALVLLSEKGRRYETSWIVGGLKGEDLKVESFLTLKDQDLTIESSTELLKIEQELQDGTFTLSWKLPSSDLLSSTSLAYIRISIGGIPVLLALGDEEAMSNFYAPVISSSRVAESSLYPPQPSTSPSIEAYNLIGTDSTALVSGAPFIRRAAYSVSGSTLHLFGQTQRNTAIDIFAAPQVMEITWNGVLIPARYTPWGGFRFEVSGLSKKISDWKVPDLSKLEWKSHDSLLEIQDGFDDSDWVVANKTTTPNPYFHSDSINTEGQVLFASEYGFHGGNILWRGTFEATEDDLSSLTGFSVRVEGGRSFAFSLWLNEIFLGSAFGDREKAAATLNATFPSSALKSGKNTFTIVQDHMGLEMEYGALPIGLVEDDDELEAFKLPRGIISYNLLRTKASTPDLSSNSTPLISWKVVGNLGGESPPDSIRTNFNEGGLLGERLGWHLPGFDDSTWESRSPWEGLKSTTFSSQSLAGVGFFRTSFNLSLPHPELETHDIALGIRFSNSTTNSSRVGKYRVQLYVQGWQFGKLISDLGPQTYFPIPRGILNFEGENTLAISLWSTQDEEISSRLTGPIQLEVEAKWRGMSSKVRNIGQGWEELRGKKISGE